MSNVKIPGVRLKHDHNNSKSTCAASRCLAPSSIIYFDLGLCDLHWAQHCAAESEKSVGEG